MINLLLAATFTLIAAGGPGSWLDAQPLVNWNRPQIAAIGLPARPGAADPQLGPGGRCLGTTRPPTALEDHALTQKGWSMVGPYQRYGVLSVVTATAGVDGMCRPAGYQGFVFVNGWFAGTLSPHDMEARTDGSITSLSIVLYNQSSFAVDYVRYTSDDPLCCPRSTSTVQFQIKSLHGKPVVVPTSVSTQKNPQ